MARRSRKLKYRNTLLLALSLIVLFFISDTALAYTIIKDIESYGYFGSAVVGMFFVSTFTVAPASVVLFSLAQDLNPYLLALSAGIGGVVGDILIFRFFKDGVFEELRPLFRRYGGAQLHTLLRTRYFAWVAPIIGAILIASPIPDEIGIALIGITRMKFWHFVSMVFVLDTLGIFALAMLARSI